MFTDDHLSFCIVRVGANELTIHVSVLMPWHNIAGMHSRVVAQWQDRVVSSGLGSDLRKWEVAQMVATGS